MGKTKATPLEPLWPRHDARQADYAWAAALGHERVLVEHRRAADEAAELAALAGQAQAAQDTLAGETDPIARAPLQLAARAAQQAWDVARSRPQHAANALDRGVADRRRLVAHWCLQFPDEDPAPGVPRSQFVALTHVDAARRVARIKPRFDARMRELGSIGADGAGSS